MVTLLNWESYNPRSDVKKPSWFRVEYRLLEDPDFYDFTHEEFKVWLYFLAQACRKNSPTITINFKHALAVSNLSLEAVVSAAQKLETLKQIELRYEHVTDTIADVTPTNATGRDGTGRDERNGTARNGTNGTSHTPSSREGAKREQIPDEELLKPEVFVEREVSVSEKLNRCIAEWGETLKHYGIDKDPSADMRQISKLIASKGFERTINALRGFRFEQGDEEYKPAKYCYLDRLKKKFEYLENLGASNKPRERKVRSIGDVKL